MDWYYYIAIIVGAGIGVVIIYIFARRHGYMIPYLSNVVDPLLFGNKRRAWDNKDTALEEAYNTFDNRPRKERIQDRTSKKVGKTYTRREYAENRDNIRKKWKENQDDYDILGVDTPEPPYPNRMITLFTGIKAPRLVFDSKNNLVLESYASKQYGARIKSTGVTPRPKTAANFGEGVIVKMRVDNRKRSHEQKVRPMPYFQGRYYPEYSTKAHQSSASSDEYSAFSGEKEWNSRDPMKLSKRDVKAIYVADRKETTVRNRLPDDWQDKVVVVSNRDGSYVDQDDMYKEAERSMSNSEKKDMEELIETDMHGSGIAVPKWAEGTRITKKHSNR